MKKMNNIRLMIPIRVLFNSLRVLINDVLEGLTLEAFFGLFILNVLLVINLSNILKIYAFVIYLLISGFSWILLLSYCRNSLTKTMDDWDGKDYILFILNFIFLAISLMLLNRLLREKSNVFDGRVQILPIIYSYFALAYIMFVTLNLVIKNRIIILITIASILYGLINDQNFKILLGILVFALGQVDKDEIKTILGIENFAEYKFIEDKFIFILAIVCCMFVNEYGEIIINLISKKVELNFEDDVLKYILNMGVYKLFMSIALFVIIFIIYELNKEKLKIRYSKKDDSISTDSFNEVKNNRNKSEPANSIDDVSEPNFKREDSKIIEYSVAIGIILSIVSEYRSRKK